MAGQTTTGSITGTIVDPQGRAVPQAKVSLTNTDKGTIFTAATDNIGHFVFPVLLPGHYNISVSSPGFKTFEKLGLVLNANSVLYLGNLPLEVGKVVQTIQVEAQGVLLQTETAQRSDSVVATQIQNVQENGQSPLYFLRLVPGILDTQDYSTAGTTTGRPNINGTRNEQSNITLNGAGDVDTGDNGDLIATVSLDSVQEFKVLTSNYQAQYGRSAGGEISIVTKSGTSQFHGSGFEYYRDTGMNANSWLNNRDGLPKTPFHFNDFGFTIGGPVYIPGKFNTDKSKLFFFESEEWQHQLRPQGQHRVTVPTAAERTGDFSQSVDKNGKPVVIRNPFSALPCTSSNASGCFPGNVISPSSMLSQTGLAVLKLWPLPNAQSATNKGFNYVSQISDSVPRREDVIRMDYNLSSRWTFFGTYVKNTNTTTSAYGSFVLGSNIPLVPITDNRPSHLFNITAAAVINPTTTNEFTFDVAHNLITIEPDSNGLTRSATGLSDLPTLFPPHADFIPHFTFNGTRIANSPSFGTADAPFFNFNTTFEFIDNLSKIVGQHFLKAGIYFQRSRKDQTSFAAASGNYDFGDSPSNPLDTGFGFANAALGIFNNFNQASQYATGKYRYTNLEWYVQDTWKALPRLTLDYGVRFYYIQPQYDAALLTSNFLPNKWDPSQTPLLFQPGFSSSGQRVAINPVDGQTFPAVDIGDLVPGTGNQLNGVFQAGRGISKYLTASPGILTAPRFGFTYDLTGNQNVIFHAGGGVFFDRFQGNRIFDEITNPPTTFTPGVNFGQLQSLSLTNALAGPSSLKALDFGGNIPTVYNYSAGIETKLPYAINTDVSYVGSLSRHLTQAINLNAVPYGATFLPQNQDSTLLKARPNATLGSNALQSQFLVPFRGFADSIRELQFAGNSNYNSLQVSLNRRYAKGLFLGVAYTWSRCMDAAGSNDGGGNFVRIDNLNFLANYGPCDFNVTNNFAADYVYQIPSLAAHVSSLNNPIVRGALNDWQISGFINFISGTPHSVGFSIPNIGSAEITGSYTEGARLLCVANPTAGTSDSPYNRINAAAFAPPAVASIGLGCSRNFITGPGINDWDMSLARTVRLKERLSLRLRVDAFNVFNHTQFSGTENTINYSSLTSPTITNLPFNSSGVLVNKFGFGAISGVRSPRILQLVAKIVF